MKARPGARINVHVSVTAEAHRGEQLGAAEPAYLRRGESVADIYAAHSDFVWRVLQRFGIHDNDLEDVLHEVFVVVHLRLFTFDGSSRITTWLYGISLRVASAHKRRGYRQRERAVASPPDSIAAGKDPETQAADAEARRTLERILDRLDLEKRAVLVMFEIDELSCEEIAQVTGVPVGTVYSRLHSARKAFQKELSRVQAAWTGGSR